VFDAYGTLLAKVLYPGYEALRGRSTLPYLRFLQESQWWSQQQLQDLQQGLLRRLLLHAVRTTAFYRFWYDEHGIVESEFASPDILARLPLLTRELVQNSTETRVSHAPPYVAVRKNSSGTTGRPVQVAYNAGSQQWRDAMRMRGYGWAGYQIGHRTLHYWGAGGSAPLGWWQQAKKSADHRLRRDLYIDSNLRTEESLRQSVAQIRTFKPNIIVAFAQAIAHLARFINEHQLRDWPDIPVIVGAERLWPHDRSAIEQAFGRSVFETYGNREMMLLAAECDQQDGMHVSMETIMVEIIVRNSDGTSRTALPGETGEVVVTDLQNLAAPLIRYISGDRAVQRADVSCPCGRHLKRIGPIEGRVIETLTTANGDAVSGIAISILFLRLTEFTTEFQLTQRADRSIVLSIVPRSGSLSPEVEKIIRDHLGKYMPGIPLTIAVVPEIPLTTGGKLRLVINEGASAVA
jgi:phenylacetate-CoA ligase